MTNNFFSTSEQKLKWKRELQNACVVVLEQRINNAQQAMQQAQEAANSEDKSSAGDKHETARAMSQHDRDMHAKQLEDAKRELQLLNSLKIDVLHNHACSGAFVLCEQHSFFISLGLGSINFDGNKVIALSPNAPIARLLDKKKAKDKFLFNGKKIEILDVF